MPLVISTSPTSEPVSLSDLKDHSYIDIADDDSLIDGYITAARMHLESETKRAFVTQTWKVYMDHFDYEMILPLGRIQSVSSVTYVDDNGATQTLATSVYTVDTFRDPGRVVLAYGQVWPTVRDQINAVVITYVAGYGSASSVPSPIRTAISLLTAHLYENREATTTSDLSDLPMGVEALISPYRIRTF